MNRKQEAEAERLGKESARNGGGNDNPYHSGRMREWFTFEDAKRDAAPTAEEEAAELEDEDDQ